MATAPNAAATRHATARPAIQKEKHRPRQISGFADISSPSALSIESIHSPAQRPTSPADGPMVRQADSGNRGPAGGPAAAVRVPPRVPADVLAVGLHVPCRGVVLLVGAQDVLQFGLDDRVADGGDSLHPPGEVPRASAGWGSTGIRCAVPPIGSSPCCGSWY